MSVSIYSSSIATLGKIGWEKTFGLLRAGANNANKRDFLDALDVQALVLINASYTIVPLAIVDEEYADVAALIVGEAIVAGNILRIVGSTTEDLADDALATAKGGAVAAADLFLMGATTVTYQGNGTGIAVQANLDAAYALDTPELSAAAFVTLSTHV